MKAMILAAGRGERMRPLTDSSPKPLLKVAGKALIVHHIEKLAQAGIKSIVINHAWLGAQIEQTLGSGQQFGVSIYYSPEPAGGLETAGGIIKALPLLGDDPFLVINGDIWSDLDYQALANKSLSNNQQAHLYLVSNPQHNPNGDFQLDKQGQVLSDGEHKLTFSGIGLYHPSLFHHQPIAKTPLAPILRAAMMRGKITGQHYSGQWFDIGTPERLAELNKQLM